MYKKKKNDEDIEDMHDSELILKKYFMYFFNVREENRHQRQSVFCSSSNSNNTVGGPQDTGVSVKHKWFCHSSVM